MYNFVYLILCTLTGKWFVPVLSITSIDLFVYMKIYSERNTFLNSYKITHFQI